jgi:hypothetical protein
MIKQIFVQLFSCNIFFLIFLLAYPSFTIFSDFMRNLFWVYFHINQVCSVASYKTEHILASFPIEKRNKMTMWLLLFATCVSDLVLWGKNVGLICKIANLLKMIWVPCSYEWLIFQL